MMRNSKGAKDEVKIASVCQIFAVFNHLRLHQTLLGRNVLQDGASLKVNESIKEEGRDRDREKEDRWS